MLFDNLIIICITHSRNYNFLSLNCVNTIYIKGDVVMGAMYLIENCSDHKSSTFTLLNCIPQCNHPRPWKNVWSIWHMFYNYRSMVFNGTFTTIFQLYRGAVSCFGGVSEGPDETTDLSQVADKLYNYMN